MGLDAFVRCRCFEEGRVSQPPVPMEDLYVDEEGYIASRTLCSEYERLGYKMFYERHGELEDQLRSWSEACCSHEDMHLCDEWVCNISGWSKLRWLFQALGEETPILGGMLPTANGGTFPSKFADAALNELAVIEGRLPQLLPGTYTDLVSLAEGIVRWRHYDGEAYDWRHHYSRLEDGRFSYWNDRQSLGPSGPADFSSAHFKATLIEGKIDRYHNMERKGTVLLEDLEGKSPDFTMRWWSFCQVDSMFKEEPVEYLVKRGSDEEWGRWKIGIIRRLLEASKETGNPIHWC